MEPKTTPKNKRSAARRSLQDVVRVRLVDLLKTLKGHKWLMECPKCGEDCGRIACVDLVYSWDVCGCEEAPYKHLVKRVHHKRCYTGAL